MKGKLFLVATPIGNLGDFSARAIETLKNSDVIYCEDTRVTAKLLSRFDISKPLRIYETHRENRMVDDILSNLDMGKKVSLVSDAGYPGISDPGEILFRKITEKKYEMTVIPGASAGISALLLSGFPTSKFFFEGFLPSRGHARQNRLKELLKIPYTVILYEAPHRMIYLLNDLEKLAPERKISVSRELTKIHEETVRGTAGEIKSHFNESYKGEFVAVLSPFEEEMISYDDEDIIDLLSEKIDKGFSNKDAVKEIAKLTGRKKNEVYSLMLKPEEQND